MPRRAVRLERQGQTTLYEGPLLADVLARAGAPSGAALRGETMALTALITARDGYQVAFTLAELDPAFAGTIAILADSADGAAISDEDGPFRIVVEGDRRGARSARMVARIEIVRPGR